MENDIQNFSFNGNQVRVVMINSEPYFVGKDVTGVLGYKNANDALNKHIENEDKGVAFCDTLGGKQKMTVINESGLYSLIISSKLPQAKQFKHWVTSEGYSIVVWEKSISDKYMLYLTDPDYLTDSEAIFTDSEFSDLIKYIKTLPDGEWQSKVAEHGKTEVKGELK